MDLFEVNFTSPGYRLWKHRGVEVVLLKLHAEDLALFVDTAEMLELAHFLRV